MHASRLRTILAPVALAATGLALTACGSTATTGAALGGPATTTTMTTTMTTTAPTTTTTTTHTAAAATNNVYVETIDSTGPQQKPTSLTLDNHDDIDGLTWSSWGSQTATGHGTVHIDDCTPDCASGHNQDIRATITLTTIKTINNHQEYTTFSLTWPGQTAVDAKTWHNLPLGN